MFKTKKSLGQNFLKSKSILEKIVRAAGLRPEDIVVEVGPGEGVLTEHLLKQTKQVMTIEKDSRLIPVLAKKFSDEIANNKLKIVEGDILKQNLADLGLKNGSFKVVANLPYYITGQFLRKILEDEPRPVLMVLMLQKEVVKRIIASGQKESLLSLSIKAYGKPKQIAVVSKKNFKPEPNVDSAIVLIDQISNKYFEGIDNNKPGNASQNFFNFIHAAFAHKRKLAASNLEKSGYKEIKNAFRSCKIDPKIRAEDINLENFACLLKTVGSYPHKETK